MHIAAGWVVGYFWVCCNSNIVLSNWCSWEVCGQGNDCVEWYRVRAIGVGVLHHGNHRSKGMGRNPNTWMLLSAWENVSHILAWPSWPGGDKRWGCRVLGLTESGSKSLDFFGGAGPLYWRILNMKLMVRQICDLDPSWGEKAELVCSNQGDGSWRE